MPSSLPGGVKIAAVVTAIAMLIWTCPASAAEKPPTVPFVVEWPPQADSPVDVSFLLEKPAGKSGHVRAQEGHLVTGDGRRLRIWGINITMRAAVPEKSESPVLAAHLARLGINCVRLHMLDTRWGALLDPKRKDTRQLDPAQLDKLDVFIAELKKSGIYTDLNLNVARHFQPGDQVKDHELLGYAKALTYFDPRIIELQKEYARQLLTHRNPYTGSEYRSEPAIAIVELLNENSLIEAWFEGRLLGENTRRNPGTWTDIPASYAADLDRLYNQYLEKNLPAEALAKLRVAAGVAQGAPVPRLRPKEFAKAPPERFQTEARFYLSVEAAFFTDMTKFLKEELGVKSVLIGNSDHAHHKSGYPVVFGTSLLDVVDGHVYWQHPSYITDPQTGKNIGFKIKNTPMVDDPTNSTVVELSRSAVAGKPYTVSEANHPFPAEHAAEGLPILCAYAALHDWDGIFWYTLGHQSILTAPQKMGGHFDWDTEPVKLAQIPAGALMFLRGDVRPASKTIERTYTREQVIESIRLKWDQRPFFTPNFPRALPLVHSTRVKSFDGPPTGVFEQVPDASPIRSDTGELVWSYGAPHTGLVRIDTPRSQALVGFVTAAGTSAATSNLRAQVANEFCALTAGSLDGQPIATSGKLLLTAGARVENTDMRWNDKRTSLEDWGNAPTRIEVVRGTIILTGLSAAKRVEAQPLDGAGRPTGKPVIASQSGQDWEIELGAVRTTWYVIRVDR